MTIIKYPIELTSFEIEAVNFKKIKSIGKESLEVDPEYNVFVEKEDGSIKNGILLVQLNNEYFSLQLLLKGIFKHNEDKNIENDVLSEIIIPLLVPFARTIIHHQLLYSGFNNILIPTIDIQRSLNNK